MKKVLFLVLCCTLVKADRTLQTTTFTVISDLPWGTFQLCGFLGRIYVELVNISDVPQPVTVEVLDHENMHTAGFELPNVGRSTLPSWSENPAYPTARTRAGRPFASPLTATMTVSPHSKAVASWSVSCRADNNGLTAACQSTETNLVGYCLPSSAVIKASQFSSSYRLRITSTSDRGAILGSVTHEQWIVVPVDGVRHDQITRELNGGRPF